MPLPTILIEDNVTIRASLIPALVEFAHVEIIAIAETPAQAIAAFDRHAGVWRLAVVDVFLRDGNGLQVLGPVRRRSSDQHVVVLTNYATADIRKRALAGGADAVFDKSTELDPFLDLCASFAAGAAPPRDPSGAPG